MTRASSIVAAVAAAVCLLSGLASAGNQRTFVASTGIDTNPCSLAQPCRSFAAAMALTNAVGEVIVLESAGYGPVIIAQSVTITAPPGVYAGISVTAGNGVTIGGLNIDVTLRGLSIDGQGGSTGISYLLGRQLVIERCSVTGMTGAGISIVGAGGSLTISDTQIRQNLDGIRFIDLGGTVVTASLDRVRSEYNIQNGLIVAAGGRVQVTDSVFSHNGQLGVKADPVATNPFHTRLQLAHSIISQNGFGGVHIQSIGGSGIYDPDTDVRLLENVISDNGFSGVWIDATAATAYGLVTLTRNHLQSNQVDGLHVMGNGGTGGVIVYMSGNAISHNRNDGIYASGSAVLWSLGDSLVSGNLTADVAASIAHLPPI